MPTRERVLELIEYVKAGRIPEAIQEFYADDAVMQENRQPPTVGKAANQALIEWIFDYTTRDGQRIRMEEIAQQMTPAMPT